MSKKRDELFTEIATAQDFADWIYHDMRLDCDNSASSRTVERLALINDQFGQERVFGMAGWWAISSYWMLEEAYRARGWEQEPDLLPKNVEKVLENKDEPIEKRRAFVSAQQFISTMSRDDVEMARAIFDAAYDTGAEAFMSLMYSVLVLSIRISNAAKKIKQGEQ